MDVRKWCNSGSRTIRFGRCCDKTRPGNSPNNLWKVLWLKFKRQKRKIFGAPGNSVQVKYTYDLRTYSQNFDQGFSATEPDNISTSFSVRFAEIPPRIFLQNTGGM